jgi:hypothetical protein
MRKLDWKQDGSDLMEEAEGYYQEAMNTHRWERKPQKHEVVYAFKAEESEPEVERQQPRNTYEDTIKALTAQLKEYAEAYTAKWGNPNTSEEKDRKFAWKLIPPRDNEPSMKKVYVDGKTKAYHWCPHHLQWTIHSPMECKRQPSRMKKKGMFKKAKKRENFKAKKVAYLQAKAAYHACMLIPQMKKKLAVMMMMRTPTNHSLITHQKEAMPPDMKGVGSGDHYYLMQPIYSS